MMSPRIFAGLLLLAWFPIISVRQAVTTAGAAKPGKLAASAGAAYEEIQVTARKYHFTPDPIRVQQGEPVLLVVTALDHEHGFAIKALGINVLLPKRRPVQIPLPTNRPGVYAIHCSHFCGLFHFWMKGKLIITPATQRAASTQP